MAYQIFRFDKTFLTLVDDGLVDTTASDLVFIGKNFARYGEILNQNMMFLLENFSSGNPPPRPLSGQLWYDSNTKTLNYYTGNEWKKSPGGFVASEKPLAASVGDFWWDSSQNQLYVYNGSDFILIGPDSGGSELTQHKTLRINDSIGNVRTVIAAFVNTQIIYIVSSIEFIINSNQVPGTPSLSGFTTIRRGVNLRGDLTSSDFKFWGTAHNADNVGGFPAFQYVKKNTSGVIEEDTISVNKITRFTQGNPYVTIESSVKVDDELYAATGLATDNQLRFVSNGNTSWLLGVTQNHSALTLSKGVFSLTFDSSDMRVKTTSGVKIDSSLLDDTLDVKITDISNFTSDDLQEGTSNRYFTNARARQAISVNTASGLRYDSQTGVMSLDGDILGPQLNISLSAFSSDNLKEGTKNIYHTPARARAALSVDINSRLTYDQITGVIGLPLQFSDSIENHPFNTWLSATNTVPGAPSPKILSDVISALSCPLPPGTVIHVAQTTAPAGFLKADGRAVSRSQFAALFAAIGTAYGAGNGTTTFNIPDLRGEFIRGVDDGRGIDSGRQIGSSQEDNFKTHTHAATTNSAGTHSHSGTTDQGGAHGHRFTGALLNRSSHRTSGSGAGGFLLSAEGGATPLGPNSSATTSASVGQQIGGSETHNHNFTTNAVGNHTHTISVTSTGGNETRPRNIALLACIKT
jgi:microcystin-dependent protein